MLSVLIGVGQETKLLGGALNQLIMANNCNAQRQNSDNNRTVKVKLICG